MSSHLEQVESLIMKAVQGVLTRGLSDPRVRGLISVTKVKVSPDLANADVWISVLPEKHANLTHRALQHASSHIRSAVSGKVALRKMPRISFLLDESLKKQAAIHSAINQAIAMTPQDDEDHTDDESSRKLHEPEDFRP